MSKEQFANIAFEDRKEVVQIAPKVLFFALILLLSHVLEIKPSEFDAGGIKLAINDVVIIRGGIALLFLYYFWLLTSTMISLSIYDPLDLERPMLVSLIVMAKRPYVPLGKKRRERRTPKQVKRFVWWRIFAYHIWMLPFALIGLFLVLGALGFALYDAFQFCEYLKVKVIEIY